MRHSIKGNARKLARALINIESHKEIFEALEEISEEKLEDIKNISAYIWEQTKEKRRSENV